MSKSWQSFDGRIRVLKQHLQLSDLALSIANNKATINAGKGKKIAEALGGSLQTHQQLNIPNEKKDITRTFITSRNKLHEQAIIEVYGEFSNYIASIILEIEKKQPKRFLDVLSKHKETGIKYNEIIELGCYDLIIEEIANRAFRTLQSKRSTKDLLDKIINITEIEIDPEIYNKALVYLELRHLIIHNNTKADEKFMNLAKHDLVKVNSSNNKIQLNYQVSNDAITAIFCLCKNIDDALIDKELV